MVAEEIGITPAMNHAQVQQLLHQHRAAHEARQWDRVANPNSVTEGMLRPGLVLLRHFFLPDFRRKALETTFEKGEKGYTSEDESTYLVMGAILSRRFRTFLQDRNEEPDFLRVGNWALKALGAGPDLSVADAKTLLATSRARDSAATFDKRKDRRDARTTDLAMGEALRLLRVCLEMCVRGDERRRGSQTV